MADDFERMSGGGEVAGIGNDLDQIVQCRLEPGGKLYVVDGSAVDADEMVMMAGEPLGEFISSDPFGAVVWGQDIGLGHHGKRSVQRREGDRGGNMCVELRRRAGPVGLHESGNHLAAALRVADSGLGEASPDLCLNGRACHPGCPLVRV